MTQDYAPAILADETTTAGTIVGTGVSTTFLLFFEQSFQRMIPYIFICSIVILIDLIFGIKAAKKRGEDIRVSRAIRRTMGKATEYFCWSVLASTLAVATDIRIIETGLMLLVIGIELISVAQNWYFWKFGKKVKVDALKAAEAVIEAKTGASVKGAITIENEKNGTDRKKNI